MRAVPTANPGHSDVAVQSASEKRHSAPGPDARQGWCLSELSVPILLSGALGLSAVLWAAIFSVL